MPYEKLRFVGVFRVFGAHFLRCIFVMPNSKNPIYMPFEPTKLKANIIYMLLNPPYPNGGKIMCIEPS